VRSWREAAQAVHTLRAAAAAAASFHPAERGGGGVERPPLGSRPSSHRRRAGAERTVSRERPRLCRVRSRRHERALRRL